ncbi:hypothetical protein JW905_01570, partial [bacterium]|nr:hypothetical protein [candidate division CSSED10-310 bacterium]
MKHGIRLVVMAGVMFVAVIAGVAAGGGRELMDVWHLPVAPYPPGFTMRHPLAPQGWEPVMVFIAGEPTGHIESGEVLFRVGASGSWTAIDLQYFVSSSGYDFWIGTLPASTPSITMAYYFAMHAAGYDDTYVYGTDQASYRTDNETAAAAGAFSYTTSSYGSPTPTPMSTETPL